MKKEGEERKAMISFYIGYFGDVLTEKNKEKEDHLAITFSKFRASYAIIYRLSFYNKISPMNEW